MDIFGAFQLRHLIYFSLLLMTALSCNRVHEENIPPSEQAEEAGADLFSRTDSLYLAGEFQPVCGSLLSLMGADSTLENEVLFRMLGLYHGRAMEDEFVSLLDSLELEGFGLSQGFQYE